MSPTCQVPRHILKRYKIKLPHQPSTLSLPINLHYLHIRLRLVWNLTYYIAAAALSFVRWTHVPTILIDRILNIYSDLNLVPLLIQ